MTTQDSRQIPGGHILQTAVANNPLLNDASGALQEHIPKLGKMGAAQLLWKLGRLMDANAVTKRRDVV